MFQIGGPSFFKEDQSQLSSIVPSVTSVSDVAVTVDYGRVYNNLHLVNDGFSTVYYAFDKTAEANNAFLILESGESKIYDGQFSAVSFICDSGTSSQIRAEVK